MQLAESTAVRYHLRRVMPDLTTALAQWMCEFQKFSHSTNGLSLSRLSKSSISLTQQTFSVFQIQIIQVLEMCSARPVSVSRLQRPAACLVPAGREHSNWLQNSHFDRRSKSA